MYKRFREGDWDNDNAGYVAGALLIPPTDLPAKPKNVVQKLGSFQHPSSSRLPIGIHNRSTETEGSTRASDVEDTINNCSAAELVELC